LGGVGSSAGRAACAMARCTRATGIAIDRRRRRAHQKAKGAARRRQVS
jgi:ribosomal protein L13E